VRHRKRRVTRASRLERPVEVPQTPRMSRALRIAVVSGVVGLAVAAAPQPANPYRTIDTWLHAPASRVLGSMSSADAAPDGTLFVAERCGENNCLGHDDIAPILHVAADGRWLGSFGAGLLAWPHGIHVDRDGNVWVTDARAGEGRGHQVIKFSPAGVELMRLGTAGVAGSDGAHFNGPTDVVVGVNGDIFVSDGHETDSNNRVVKFSEDGRFLMAWGGTGSGPGQFLVPHAIALDSRGRVLVADRDNNRIQIFDQNGKFLDEWRQFGRPSGLYVGDDDTLYVSDNQSNAERNPGWARGIRIGSAEDGSVRAFIPDPEFDPARTQETGAHGLTADALGAVYGAEVYAKTVKKYALDAGR
jgi:DNA-binding beta-propeller fold protein YncE